MKPFIKASAFLIALTILDFLFRKGSIAIVIPTILPIPSRYMVLILFTVFAVLSWMVTQWFCRLDKIKLIDLGVSFGKKNRHDFLFGFFIGVILWALISMIQSKTANFTWELRENINVLFVIYGLIFIFIADLGTELFTRGYPLMKFKDSFGAKVAIIIMVFFVGLKSFSFGLGSEMLFYSITIPALHTVFFSIIYFKTNRLGGALGLHTGANFVTISIFDLRVGHPSLSIPSGIFQPNIDLENATLTALHLPWVIMAMALSVATYLWWNNKKHD